MSAPNPPAFPPAITCTAAGDVYHGYDGMSLRDYFAGQAITICLKDMSLPVSEWAREAYKIADAMLAHRSDCLARYGEDIFGDGK